MDTIAFVLLAEALAIVGLSMYLWYSVQSEPEVTGKHWSTLFVLALFVIGFVVTLFFAPSGLV